MSRVLCTPLYCHLLLEDITGICFCNVKPVKYLTFCCISPARLTCTQQNKHFQSTYPNIFRCFAVLLVVQGEYGSERYLLVLSFSGTQQRGLLVTYYANITTWLRVHNLEASFSKGPILHSWKTDTTFPLYMNLLICFFKKKNLMKAATIRVTNKIISEILG